MPIAEYFGGSGEKVMRSMKEQYGEEKGKRVFYATANKRKKRRKHNSETLDRLRRIERAAKG